MEGRTSCLRGKSKGDGRGVISTAGSSNNYYLLLLLLLLLLLDRRELILVVYLPIYLCGYDLVCSHGEREDMIVKELDDKGREIGGDADQVAVAWLLHHPAPIVSLSHDTTHDNSYRTTTTTLAL